MAFLQSEIPPSTAPSQARRASPPAAHAYPPERAVSKVAYKFVRRFAVGVTAAGALAVPGYLAASATESVAIGILAADFLFLLAVAGWSSIAGAARR